MADGPDGQGELTWTFASAAVRKEYDSLPIHGRGALFELIQRYCKGQARRDEVDYLGGGKNKRKLWELRVQVGTDPFRAVFFKDGGSCVCVLAVYKNQRKLPTKDRQTAEKRAKAWRC